MNQFEIEIVNRILEELGKSRKDRDWENNNLKKLHSKAMKTLLGRQL